MGSGPAGIPFDNTAWFGRSEGIQGAIVRITMMSARLMIGMLAAGLLEEVRGLYQRGDLSAEHPSMRAVGYRQLWRHLAGQCDLTQAVEQAVAATRQLAKRQLTWLRRRNEALWFDSLDGGLSKAVLGAIRERVAC